MSKKRRKVLFLCTGNSCRSQMAEGWARALLSNVVEPFSAGVETHGLNSQAVAVMAEVGVDISGYTSKHVDSLQHLVFDLVVTVCDKARESCPFFPGAKKKIHIGFSDPPVLARELAAQGAGEEEQQDCYRKVRDEIQAFVETLPEYLGLPENTE
jgi:arsenate reductase